MSDEIKRLVKARYTGNKLRDLEIFTIGPERELAEEYWLREAQQDYERRDRARKFGVQ